MIAVWIWGKSLFPTANIMHKQNAQHIVFKICRYCFSYFMCIFAQLETFSYVKYQIGKICHKIPTNIDC